MILKATKHHLATFHKMYTYRDISIINQLQVIDVPFLWFDFAWIDISTFQIA